MEDKPTPPTSPIISPPGTLSGTLSGFETPPEPAPWPPNPVPLINNTTTLPSSPYDLPLTSSEDENTTENTTNIDTPVPPLHGLDTPPLTPPTPPMPPSHPPLLHSSEQSLLTPADLSLTSPLTSSALPTTSMSTSLLSKNTSKVVYVLESVDGDDIVLQFDYLDRDTSYHEHKFYRQIKSTVEQLHKANDDIELIHGFVVYKISKSLYYDQVSIYHKEKFWPYKTHKDRLLVTNHIYGNKPVILTKDMKNAISSLDKKMV